MLQRKSYFFTYLTHFPLLSYSKLSDMKNQPEKDINVKETIYINNHKQNVQNDVVLCRAHAFNPWSCGFTFEETIWY